MNRREKLLAGFVAVLLGVLVLRALHGKIDGIATDRRNELGSVENELDQALGVLEVGDMAEERINTYRDRSLPNNPGVAESLYYHWLVDQLDEAGLEDIDVRAQPLIAGRADYKNLTMNVEAGGSLDALTKFLFAFYQADFLHKISRLTIIPSGSGKAVGLTMKIDALVLSDADSTDRLPEGTADRLARDDAAAYRESFVGRNIFAAYKPPPPPRPEPVVEKPKPKRFDDATQAILTGIVSDRVGGDALEAWIIVRTTGEQLRLSAGDPFEVGQMEGRVATVEPQAVVLETEEGRFKVAVGTFLRDGKLLAESGGS
jgi:hypothetical protein